MRTLTRMSLICLFAVLLGGQPGCSTPEDEHVVTGHGNQESGHAHDGGHGEEGHDAHANAAAAADHDGKHGEEHGEEHEGGHGEEGGEHENEIVELSPEAAANLSLRTAVVSERFAPVVLRTTGRVGFDESRLAHVSPRISGRVHEVLADFGDDVESGSVLAIVDSIELGEAKAEYLRARADVELASSTLAREERLFAQKISSEQSVAEARAVHKKARAAFEQTEERLRLLGLEDEHLKKVRYGDPTAPLFPVRAPIRGRIVEKHITLGELVTPRDSIFSVADLSHLWIWIDVFERDLLHVHVDDDVKVITDAYPDRVFEGRVVYIRDQVDPDTRTARARIDLDNSDGALKPGMFARVTLSDPHGAGGRGQAAKVITVPDSAVQRDGDKWIAFVALGNRRFERRMLALGGRSADLVEVKEGLELGERVLISDTFILKSEATKHQMGGGHSH